MIFLYEIEEYLANLRAGIRCRLGRGSKPDFMVIGAERSGSRSLFGMINQHSEIRGAISSSPYFLSDNHRPLEWYQAQFPTRGEQNFLVGDCHQSYLFYSLAPRLIRNFNPHLKFIAVLRDPVERVLSQRAMEITIHGKTQFGDLNRSIEQEFKSLGKFPEYHFFNPAIRTRNPGNNYLLRSHYSVQIKNWLNFFPAQQFHFVDSQELKNDPQTVIEGCYRFLGLSPKLIQPLNLRPSTVPVEIDPTLRQEVCSYFKSYDSRLNELTGRSFSWQAH